MQIYANYLIKNTFGIYDYLNEIKCLIRYNYSLTYAMSELSGYIFMLSLRYYYYFVNILFILSLFVYFMFSCEF